MTKFDVGLTASARDDIKEIADYAQERYGAKQAEAYQNVIEKAVMSISEDPLRPGSRDRSEDLKHPGLRSFHTALSNNPTETNVKNPRHLIFYFEPKNDRVLITRIIHDSRDIEHHLSQKPERGRVYKVTSPAKDKSRER